MKKFSKKGVLLFVAAMALCAFAMPSAASAASWGTVGLETTLHSPNVGFTSTTASGVAIDSNCTRSSFTADVRSAAVLTITTGTFGGLCTAALTSPGGTVICTTTAVGTKFPWVATAVATNDIRIDGVHIDVTFENTPGNALCAAGGANGLSITITGNLGGGSWLGNASRDINFSNAEGLVSHSALGLGRQITARGTFVSTGNLTVAH